MTTQRILLLSYIVLGVVLGLVVEELLGTAVAAVGFLAPLNGDIFGTSLSEFFRSFGSGAARGGRALALGGQAVSGLTWVGLIAYVAVAAFGLYAWRNAKLRDPATQVVEEMQRVTWPTAAETRAATWAVIIATGVASILLGVFDYGWAILTEQVYSPN